VEGEAVKTRAAVWFAWSLWAISVVLTALSLLLVLNLSYPNTPIPKKRSL
jgi:hypothetical protein